MDLRWREPDERERTQFTSGVMARVTALSPPHAGLEPRLRLSWPTVRMALLAATATVVCLLWLRAPADSRQIAWTVARDLQVLASLGEVAEVVPDDDEVAALEEELRLTETLLLAEAEPTDAEWIEQTLQLLDELGEGTDAGDATLFEEEMLRELELFDDEDVAVSS